MDGEAKDDLPASSSQVCLYEKCLYFLLGHNIHWCCHVGESSSATFQSLIHMSDLLWLQEMSTMFIPRLKVIRVTLLRAMAQVSFLVLNFSSTFCLYTRPVSLTVFFILGSSTVLN